eukprot:14573838-Ditylum_brightwellii.AAC.1
MSLHNNNIEANVTLNYLESIKITGYDIYQGDRTRNRAGQLQKAKRDRQQAQQDVHTKRQQYLEEKIQSHNNNKKGVKIPDEI